MKKRLSALIECDSDCGSAITRTRLRKPNTAFLECDSNVGAKLSYGQVTYNTVNYPCDTDIGAALLALRRATLGRRPVIHVSAWTNDGIVPLNGATLKRGDLHHIQADVIGSKLCHFVLTSFVVKGSMSDCNDDAIVWKSTDPLKGGIELISTTDTTDHFGMAKQHVYQIAIDPRDTSLLTSRRILHWEFQLDDTLGEVYSLAGSITVIPDVYQYPSS
jgi:hypothetical protein